jgi:hypothetical protein
MGSLYSGAIGGNFAKGIFFDSDNIILKEEILKVYYHIEDII